MKWNWGTKIFIAIILFMSMMIVLVILTMRQSYDLVEKDYYPKGLEYQQKIDKETNAKNIGEAIQVENNKSELVFTFPSIFDPESIEGEIFLYRPSDGTKDIIFPIELNSMRNMSIPTSNLISGKYLIKFDYKDANKEYFQESTVYIEK